MNEKNIDNVENVDNVIEPVAPVIELTAGQMLHNARTTGRRKREISTISKLLCISEEFLQALEDDDFTVIPEVVYILGFARNYALELGLEPEEIATKIKRQMGLLSDCADAAEGSVADVQICAVPDAEKPALSARLKKYLDVVKNRWKLFAGMAVAVIVLVVLVSVLFSGNADVENNVKSDTAVSAVVADSVDPAFKVSVRERFGNDNKDDADVILQATDESWVKVEDGRKNTVFSRVLVAGDVYYAPKGDEFKATFGNVGGIDVWVNGKLIPALGKDFVRKSDISLSADKLIK